MNRGANILNKHADLEDEVAEELVEVGYDYCQQEQMHGGDRKRGVFGPQSRTLSLNPTRWFCL